MLLTPERPVVEGWLSGSIEASHEKKSTRLVYFKGNNYYFNFYVLHTYPPSHCSPSTYKSTLYTYSTYSTSSFSPLSHSVYYHPSSLLWFPFHLHIYV